MKIEKIKHLRIETTGEEMKQREYLTNSPHFSFLFFFPQRTRLTCMHRQLASNQISTTPSKTMCNDVTEFFTFCLHYGRTWCEPCINYETCQYTGTVISVIENFCPYCIGQWACFHDTPTEEGLLDPGRFCYQAEIRYWETKDDKVRERQLKRKVIPTAWERWYENLVRSFVCDAMRIDYSVLATT